MENKIIYEDELYTIEITPQKVIIVDDFFYCFEIETMEDIKELKECNVPKCIIDKVKKLLNEKNKK